MGGLALRGSVIWVPLSVGGNFSFPDLDQVPPHRLPEEPRSLVWPPRGPASGTGFASWYLALPSSPPPFDPTPLKVPFYLCVCTLSLQNVIPRLSVPLQPADLAPACSLAPSLPFVFCLCSGELAVTRESTHGAYPAVCLSLWQPPWLGFGDR